MSDMKTPEFWIAVLVALIVKVRTSPQFGWMKVGATIAVSVGAAWVSSEWASEVLGVPGPVAAAIVTLTAEGVMRWLLLAVNDPKQAIDLWKHWRKS